MTELDIYIDSPWQQELTRRFQEGKEHKEKYPPIARLEQLTGFAKTALTEAWLYNYKVNNFYIKAPLRQVTHLEEENIDVLFSSAEIDKMDEKDIVIVIDDYDWAKLSTRMELMRLLRFSQVIDLREKDNGYVKTLNNIAMIVLITHPNVSGFSEPYNEIENQLLGEKEV